MTALRKRMIECLPLRGWSERTQDMYVRAVRPLAEHKRQSPDVITAAARRPYVLDIKTIQHDSRRASTSALGGITCVCAPTLNRDWTTLRVVRARRAHTLPVLRSLEEVRRLLGCVRLPHSRVCLATISACGLRLPAGPPLHGRERARTPAQPRPSRAGRARSGGPLARPHAGPAAPGWGDASPARRDLPGAGSRRDLAVDPPHPRPRRRGPGAGRAALTDRGLHTPAAVHPRRHAWATPVLEAGLKLRLLQGALGPNAPPTPSVDTHLTARAAPRGAATITRLMGAR